MRKYKRHIQAEMFGHIENCKQSGQAQITYFKQLKLAYSTFQYWVKKYRKEISEKEAIDRSTGFIPVKVQSELYPNQRLCIYK